MFDRELADLVTQADALKAEHPGCGVEKMYYTLNPRTMGRDKFCEIFMSLGYGVVQVKNHRKTTVAGHINYPNLIEGMVVTRPHQVVQSDITYFDLQGTFYYIVFIVDVYTKVILGHHVSSNMRTESNLKALRMALKRMKFKSAGSVHHSDRGGQYGSRQYRKELESNGIRISMGLKATDNAYAERVNGVIKNEYLHRWVIRDEKDLIHKTRKAVNHYNNERKHRGLKMKHTPSEIENTWLTLNQQERPIEVIHSNGRPRLKELTRLPLNKEEFFCPLMYN